MCAYVVMHLDHPVLVLADLSLEGIRFLPVILCLPLDLRLLQLDLLALLVQTLVKVFHAFNLRLELLVVGQLLRGVPS